MRKRIFQIGVTTFSEAWRVQEEHASGGWAQEMGSYVEFQVLGCKV